MFHEVVLTLEFERGFCKKKLFYGKKKIIKQYYWLFYGFNSGSFQSPAFLRLKNCIKDYTIAFTFVKSIRQIFLNCLPFDSNAKRFEIKQDVN